MTDPDMEQVDRAIAQLMEHFDTVQIFVTRQETDGTVNCNQGSGNWFARRGQVEDWLVKRVEEAKESIRKQDVE